MGSLPSAVIWDVTYACPLLCVHCYSESGRRDSKQLELPELLRVADALIAMRLEAVFFSGGEPLLVKQLPTVIERLTSGGIPTHVFTSGWTLDAAKVARIAPMLASVHVSLDGATPEVHDAIRKRQGGFERAMRALEALDEAARMRNATGDPPLIFGLECTLLKRNFHQVEAFVTEVAARFPGLGFVNMGAAVPSGLASEEAFARTELLGEEELELIRDGDLAAKLAGAVPHLSISDNRALQMHPDDIASGEAMTGTAQVEPNGAVRAMAIYEGTVGSLLHEAPEAIWERARARWRDPFVVDQLRPARTMIDWARAVRAIDRRFGAPDDVARISKRRSLPLVAEA